MKTPRISIHALMAAVGVIALDCMIVRAVNARPDFFVSRLNLLLIAAMPMVHILAVGAAVLARGPIRARPFLLGFEVGGGLAVLGTCLSYQSILEVVERASESTRFATWVDSLPESVMMIVAYSIILALFLIPQITLALACGWLARRFVAPRAAEPTARPRVSPPLVAVLLVAVAALAVVGYLRWVVDPRELRRPSGSEAVIDLSRTMAVRSAWPSRSPWITLDGAKVRVERDGDPCVIQLYAEAIAPKGQYKTHIIHLREVRVTILDGDRAGESTAIPHCFLRPASEAAAPVAASTVVQDPQVHRAAVER